MKQRIIILITLGLMATATSWAENHLEAVASNETETAQPETGYDLGTATELGNPVKKQMKEWKKIDQEDITALSTEQAMALRTYLADKGEKQRKRGKILFWTAFAWPIAAGLLGGATNSTALIIGCTGVGVGQMAWGYVDMLNGRMNNDASRKVIVSEPATLPDQYDHLLVEQLQRNAMRWQSDVRMGPSLTINF